MSSSIKTTRPITNIRIKERPIGDLAPADIPAAVRQAKADAERRGYEQGFLEGTTTAHAETRDLARRLHALIRSVEEFHATLSQQMEADCVHLAVRIAEKILQREVTCQDTLAQVTHLLRQTTDRQGLTVHVNPDELEPIGREMKAMETEGELGPIHLVADESVSPGGCVVDGAAGRIDAQMETQLREIEKILLTEDGDANDD